MDEQPEPKKKRGWPAGKPRGPRKPAPEPPAPSPPPEPPRAPDASYEPVQVSVVMANGVKSYFHASDFSRDPGSYTFVSYPPDVPRGYKRVTMYRMDEIGYISITAPEPYFERLKGPQPVESYVTEPQQPHQSYVRGVTPTAPEYAGGDPRRGADAKANRSQRVSRPDGAPIPQSIVVDDEGRQSVVGATMQ